MVTKLIKRFGHVFGCLAAIVIFLLICGVSWIATCGVVKLITLLFGWTYNWSIATGCWILWWIANSIFSKARPSFTVTP